MIARRRVAAAAFGACALLAYVALPSEPAGAATGAEAPFSDPVMDTLTRAHNLRDVDAVFDGSQNFVVWGEARSVSGGIDIMGARVGTDGSLPDGDGITISTAVNDGVNGRDDAAEPRVAVDSSGTSLVAWLDDDPLGRDIYAARVSASGRVLDPVAIPISVDPADDVAVDVAWNGEVFLVVFARNSTTRAVRVTTAGVVLPIGELDATMKNPKVAAAGTTFLVAGDNGLEVIGRRVASNGTVSSERIQVTDPALPNVQVSPDVVAVGSGWVLAWTDTRNGASDIFAARVDTSGAVVDPAGILVAQASSIQDSVALGVNKKSVLATWRDRRDGEEDLFGAHIDGNGVVTEPGGFAISATAAGDVPGAVVAAPGSGHTVFYLRTAPEAPYGGALRGFHRSVSTK